MRAVADGRLEVTRTFAEEMYFCLGCLACMTACPAGVQYAELFEHARAEAESSGVLNHPQRQWMRGVILRWLFGDLRRLQALGVAMRLYQQLGLQSLLRSSGLLRLLPRRLQELESMTPTVRSEFSSDCITAWTPSKTPARYRVAMLTGCAQDLIFSDVNRDTVEVLVRNGCDVETPPEQSCCGSLHAHNGEWAMAQALAREQIDLIPPERFDAIITNAAGCGSHLKHFSHLLADDPRYRDRAVLWDRKVKDIHEWLATIGITPPRTDSASPVRVTYHEACHLCHGQKITKEPRVLLRSVPGLELVELPESTWCCGSAGIYNLIQPEMAGELLDRKVKHILSTGVKVVATGNPGCLLQIMNGLRKHDPTMRVVHPVTLLAEAYRVSDSERSTSCGNT